MNSLEGCVPDEIVDFAGRIYTLGEAVGEAMEALSVTRATLTVWRDAEPSLLRASHLVALSGRQDFKDYVADLRRQTTRH
ncbi:hypothetical protein [Methylovirgula sp. 4M-Z18]|uniref:hypothetical protein n=1 Tax=Methylovirgula sp. 4M-Z18 TaxID=2293567 RepID=UPI000E2FD2FC|nr:hypothetical protein [Methylovirgula sp. 4M-Z18]RFB79730.1 hypothetical protein DYH55_09660 [Methylovirgula sp. 4M-Z18]